MIPKTHNLSLRGITGFLLGLLAIGFIYLIHFLFNQFSNSYEGISLLPISFFEILLIFIAFIFIILSYLTIVVVNKYRRRKMKLNGWEKNSKRIRGIYLIHLIIGGIFLCFLTIQGLLKFSIPLSLILYGIAGIIVNKYTFGNSFLLGISFVASGTIAVIYPNYMFYLWGFSFGTSHIIYSVFYNVLKN